MEKKVHIYQVKCNKCGTEFEHIFRASDLFRPHMFTSVDFKCPSCGQTGLDQTKSIGKLTLQEWQQEHPELDINNLPDYSYVEEK